MIYFISAIILYGISLFMYTYGRAGIINTILFTILSTIVSGLNLLYIISDYFTGRGLTNAIFFHLLNGLEGAGVSGYVIQVVAVLTLFLVSIAYTIYVCCVAIKNKNSKKYAISISYAVMIAAFMICPASRQLVTIYAQEVKQIAEIHKMNDSWIKPVGAPKNLVYLYVESLERTYSNKKYFPNLTKNLDELERYGISFSDIGQGESDWFTLGGMIASQCGFSTAQNVYKVGQKNIIHNIKCLPELLKDHGYTLAYMSGTRLGFAGTGDYYKDKGFDSVEGFEELKDKAVIHNEVSEWGLYDDETLELFFRKFKDLAEHKRPFALFGSTMDTHGPSGYVSPSCKSSPYPHIQDKILHAVSCSDILVSELVRKIINSEYANDTVVVIASDHLAMPSRATKYVGQLPRHNRLLIIPTDHGSGIVSTPGTTRDIGTTILKYIGFEGRIGLGKNLSN
ncbi:MAG: hypothetical protein FGM57_03155 [Candidatus Taylorbacteria bacterium]|nr:hypothetical protein [Candidatus Taylorbacteria bacterium]